METLTRNCKHHQASEKLTACANSLGPCQPNSACNDNRFTAILDSVRDHLGELAPER